MKYNLLIIFIIFTACATNYSSQNTKKPFSSKGFALIYKDEDFINKTVKRKLDNNFLQIAHNRLRPGTLIKIINLKTNDSIILKNNKKFQYLKNKIPQVLSDRQAQGPKPLILLYCG